MQFEQVFQRFDEDDSKSISYEEFAKVFVSGKKRRNKGGGGGGGEKKPMDPAKIAEKEEAQRKAKEVAAQKKAEAMAARKAKAAEMAAQKKAEALAARAAEEKAIKVAAELGIGTYELKGDRGYMEDRAVALRLPAGELYAAVFDGHCGEGCPEYCKNELHGSAPPRHAAAPPARVALRACVRVCDRLCARARLRVSACSS